MEYKKEKMNYLAACYRVNKLANGNSFTSNGVKSISSPDGVRTSFWFHGQYIGTYIEQDSTFYQNKNFGGK